MKKIIFIMFMLLSSLAYSQTSTITVNIQSEELANDLDLKAIAIVFSESNNVEDFEKRLNDRNSIISNLDMNGDGLVDYLRCVESYKDDQHIIIIQAVLAVDIYQDVATILVVKNENRQIVVQIIGDEFIYGTNYIIEPVYIHHPLIFDWFYSSKFVCWDSPYHWGVYPYYFHYWKPIPYHDYMTHIYNYHRDHYMSFRRPINPIVTNYGGNHRNDFAVKHNDMSYTVRHPDSGNGNRPAQEKSQRTPTTNSSFKPVVVPSYNGSRPVSVQTRGTSITVTPVKTNVISGRSSYQTSSYRSPTSSQVRSNYTPTRISTGSQTIPRTQSRMSIGTNVNGSARTYNPTTTNIRSTSNSRNPSTNQSGTVRSSSPTGGRR